MREFYVLLKNNLRLSILKKPFSFVVMIVAPVLMILILGSNILSGGSSFINIGLVDEDNSISSKVLIDLIKTTEGIQVKTMSLDEANKNFIEKNINFSVIIPKNFQENLLKGKDEKIEIEALEKENLYFIVYENLNNEIKNLKDMAVISKGKIDVYEQLLKNYNNKKIQIEKRPLNDLSYDYGVSQIFLGALIMFMFYKASSGADLISNDKNNNIYTRIFICDIKAWQYYLANICSSMVCLIIQIVLSLLALKYIIKIRLGISYSALFIILIITAILAVSIGSFCVAISKSEAEANILSNILVITFVMLGGCFIPIRIFPNFINKISYFTPTRWVMEAVLGLQQGDSFLDITKYVIVVILFAITFFMIAAYKTSKEERKFNIYG